MCLLAPIIMRRGHFVATGSKYRTLACIMIIILIINISSGACCPDYSNMATQIEVKDLECPVLCSYHKQ